MNRITKFGVAAVLLAGTAGTAPAQMLRSPVFVFQPGVVTVNAISAPTGVTSSSGFNLRFVTVIPTSSNYLSLVFGTTWTPNGVGANTGDNTLKAFYGGIIPIAQVGSLTSGWFSLSIDPLGLIHPVSYGTHAYSHDFVLEGALSLNVGSKMFPNMGAWSNLGVYFLVDQQLTHVKDAAGNSDYWNPALLYGLSLPLAPWGK